jgi:hypothetical protein
VTAGPNAQTPTLFLSTVTLLLLPYGSLMLPGGPPRV